VDGVGGFGGVPCGGFSGGACGAAVPTRHSSIRAELPSSTNRF
jgi:hypothetical protein